MRRREKNTECFPNLSELEKDDSQRRKDQSDQKRRIEGDAEMDYTEKFEELVKETAETYREAENEPPATDFSKLDKIIIGFVDGDGIGPVIRRAARKF